MRKCTAEVEDVGNSIHKRRIIIGMIVIFQKSNDLVRTIDAIDKHFLDAFQ